MKIIRLIQYCCIVSFFLILSFAEDKTLYKELNMISSFNSLQARLENSFYNLLYFEDSSKKQLIDKQLSEMVLEFDNYSKQKPYFNYCFYASQELLKIWNVKKELVNIDFDKSEIKSLIKYQEKISEYIAYCINNIISRL